MKIQDTFIRELEQCLNGRQDRIRTGSQMCNYTIQLMKERQRKQGISAKYRIALREGAPSHEFNHFGDLKYDVTNCQEHVFLETEYFKNGRPVYKYGEDNLMLMYVENLRGEKVDGSETVNCPNCGVPATLEMLSRGCSYCGTHFEMSDIYPIVTNYVSMYDVSMVEDQKNLNTPAGILKTYAKGYAKFAKLLQRVPSALSMVSEGGLTSRRRFESIMKQYIPDFSYMHFGDAAINMLKALLFSDDPASFPFLKKDSCPVIAPGLIDFEFMGFGLSNSDVAVRGNHVIANVFIYVRSLYDRPNGIVKVEEKYRAVLSRDISRPVKMGFSYTKINCPSCGGVFDAVREKNCPYCNTPYKLQDEEWFVLDISRG